MNHIDPSDRQGYQALIFSMSFTIVFMIYLSFFYSGVILDAPPEEVKQKLELDKKSEEGSN